MTAQENARVHWCTGEKLDGDRPEVLRDAFVRLLIVPERATAACIKISEGAAEIEGKIQKQVFSANMQCPAIKLV